MADEFDLKPTSRGEEFLDVILRSLGGDTPDIPQPAWRYEEYLAAIANAIQNGGGGSSGGVLVVNMVYDEQTDTTYSDKTWKEIHDAPMAVIVDVLIIPGGVTVKNICPVERTYQDSNEYSVFYYTHEKVEDKVLTDAVKLVTDSENGYLTWAE